MQIYLKSLTLQIFSGNSYGLMSFLLLIMNKLSYLYLFLILTHSCLGSLMVFQCPFLICGCDGAISFWKRDFV